MIVIILILNNITAQDIYTGALRYLGMCYKHALQTFPFHWPRFVLVMSWSSPRRLMS